MPKFQPSGRVPGVSSGIVGTATGRFGRAALVALVCLQAAEAAPAQHPQALLDRAGEAFAAGRLETAVEQFDRLAELDPEAAPWLWQRGIALYYLGRFEACAAQFAEYLRVSPDDLESAVWHTACVARDRSLDVARRTMRPPGRDGRVLRAEIYEMFAGRLPASAVIERAGFIAEVAAFYAYFYGALHAEVAGDPDEAARLLARATEDRFAGLGGFMNVVAHVHRARLAASGGGDEEER